MHKGHYTVKDVRNYNKIETDVQTKIREFADDIVSARPGDDRSSYAASVLRNYENMTPERQKKSVITTVDKSAKRLLSPIKINVLGSIESELGDNN